MKLDEHWIIVEGVRTWSSRPAVIDTALPLVLLIQEAWGVDGHIRDLAGRFATAGYAVLAPDLLAAGAERPVNVTEERVDAVKAFLDTMPPGAWGDANARKSALGALTPDQAAHVEETMGLVFSQMSGHEQHLRTLRAAIDVAGNAPVGSVGFCMGGALSARLACQEPRLRSAVIFYGWPPPEDQIPNISCPVLGNYGSDDVRLTGTVPGFASQMEAAGKSFEYHVYAGAPHAFFNDTRSSYRVDAARAAWASTLGFFDRTLAD